MARTKAMRRHHMWRMKNNRRKDALNGDGSPHHLGMHYQTPRACSCDKCGNRRTNRGPNMQERREIVRAKVID